MLHCVHLLDSLTNFYRTISQQETDKLQRLLHSLLPSDKDNNLCYCLVKPNPKRPIHRQASSDQVHCACLHFLQRPQYAGTPLQRPEAQHPATPVMPNTTETPWREKIWRKSKVLNWEFLLFGEGIFGKSMLKTTFRKTPKLAFLIH